MTLNDHNNLEKLNSTALMLPKESEDEKVKIQINPKSPPHDKILIREDTILGNIQGCPGCGRVRFTCSGTKSRCNGLCWGKKSDRKYAWITVGLILTFVFSLAGTVVFCFTNLFNDTIISNMVLKNDSMAFEMWRKPPVRPLVKIHIFNYTNLEEFRSGSEKKLRLKDVGPYVYQQDVERVNCVFNDDGTLTYQEKRGYTFRSDLSSGHEYDKLVVPNLSYLAAISYARDKGGYIREPLSLLMTNSGSRPFVPLTVHSFLWGYEDPLVNWLKPFLQLQKLPDKMGIMVSKNGTQRDRITIETGANNTERLAVIHSINGEKKMRHWSTDECNRLDATDGSMFAPSTLDRKQILHIFDKDMCRRLPFKYVKDVEVFDGIPALRYSVPSDVFDDPSRNLENQCFCNMGSGICPPRGVFNASPCAQDAPVLVSFPHFYLGEDSLFEHLDGLEPSEDKHKMHLDIHPRLGFPLSAVSRLQINMQVRKFSTFFNTWPNFLDDLMILPIIWMEVNVEELPLSLRTLVYHGTYSAAALQLAMSWGCSLLLLASAFALTLLVARRLRPAPAPCATADLLLVPTQPDKHDGE